MTVTDVCLARWRSAGKASVWHGWGAKQALRQKAGSTGSTLETTPALTRGAIFSNRIPSSEGVRERTFYARDHGHPSWLERLFGIVPGAEAFSCSAGGQHGQNHSLRRLRVARGQHHVQRRG